jgi:O-antigen/teichoic acid export membrane protein
MSLPATDYYRSSINKNRQQRQIIMLAAFLVAFLAAFFAAFLAAFLAAFFAAVLFYVYIKQKILKLSTHSERVSLIKKKCGYTISRTPFEKKKKNPEAHQTALQGGYSTLP